MKTISRMPERKCFFVLLLAVAGLFVFCSKDNGPVNLGGGSSESGNALVTGHLYNADKTPAVNATVQLVKTTHNPQAGQVIVAQTTTNATGEYRFETLAKDVYNVFGQGAQGVSYRDSVEITEDTLLPPDTLKASGSLSGVVKLVPNNDSGQIFIILLGTNYYTSPSDTHGNFTIPSMAQGKYRAIVLTTNPGYMAVDTELTFISGQALVMRDTVKLNSTVIPAPTGFVISYDTLHQLVALTWNKSDTSRVKGYNIYRQHLDSTRTVLNGKPVLDTFYVDSSGIQDETYFYTVVAIGIDSKEGLGATGNPVKVISAFPFIKNFGDAGTGVGQFSAPEHIAVDKSGNLWIAEHNRSKVMEFNSNGQFLREWGVQGVLPGQLNYPHGIDLDGKGNVYVSDLPGSRIQKFDTSGTFLMQIDRIDSISSIRIGDVSVDENGNIYLLCSINSTNNAVVKYSADTTTISIWPLAVGSIGSAILARHGRVYATGITAQYSTTAISIVVFDTAGSPLSTINVRRPGETRIINIKALGIDSRDNLYAADAENGLVRIFSSDFSYFTSFGRKGDGATNFSWIQGIVIAPDASMAITDRTMVHLFRLP